jgi:hypothetical protein
MSYMSFTLISLRRSTARSAITFLVLGSLLLCGACGTEKRVKECVSRCEAEGESCARRKEPNCAARGRECAEACEHNAK